MITLLSSVVCLDEVIVNFMCGWTHCQCYCTM